MPVISVNPYIILDGTAEKAIQLYQKALGAKVEGEIMRFGETKDAPTGSEHKNRVMHAALLVGPTMIMLSDSMPGQSPSPEGTVNICLQFKDAADMAKRFDALAAGGRVTMALHDAFWGSKFGALTDAFGVQWMFNCDHKDA